MTDAKCNIPQIDNCPNTIAITTETLTPKEYGNNNAIDDLRQYFSNPISWYLKKS